MLTEFCGVESLRRKRISGSWSGESRRSWWVYLPSEEELRAEIEREREMVVREREMVVRERGVSYGY
jgi:hypothetical protein